MLMGVGLSMAKGGAIIPYPETIGGLQLWLRYNTGHTTTTGATTLTGTINDEDPISRWEDYSANKNHAEQSTTADCPLFESDNNTLYWVTNSRWYDLTSDISLTSNFTCIMRIRLITTTNDNFFGDSSSNFFRLTNSKSFRAKIGGHTQTNYTEVDDTLTSGIGAPFYTIIFRRNSGEITVTVDGGSYSKKQSGEAATDSDTFTISNIVCQADDNQEMGGYVKDALIYNKFLTDAQISGMLTFLGDEG